MTRFWTRSSGARDRCGSGNGREGGVQMGPSISEAQLSTVDETGYVEIGWRRKGRRS